jgi:hypothetical protein
MLDTTTQLLISQAVKSKGVEPLTFITGLKYNADTVKTLNNITFLFDPNWQYEPQNPTYPIAFFHVKKVYETMESEVSQKPVLFYNSESVDTPSVHGGLTNVISDNIINKPKVYKLDVLVPMNMNTYMNTSAYSLGRSDIANNFIFSKGKSGANQAISAVINIAGTINSILGNLFTSLYGLELSASSFFTTLTQQQDYNKNSIEYMWRNRRILKLKLWNSWKFKYLVINNFEVSKEGVNGEYYEGTLTCQELPIMTLRENKNLSTTFLSQISSVLGTGIKKATDAFVSAMETVGGIKDDN